MEKQYISLEEPESVESEICETEEELLCRELTYEVLQKILQKEEFRKYREDYFLEIFARVQREEGISQEEWTDFEWLLKNDKFQKEAERWLENINFSFKGSKKEITEQTEKFGNMTIDSVIEKTKERLLHCFYKRGIERGDIGLDNCNVGVEKNGDILYLNESGEVEILLHEPIDKGTRGNFLIVKRKDGKMGIYDIIENCLISGWQKNILRKKRKENLSWVSRGTVEYSPVIFDDKVRIVSDDGLEKWQEIATGKEIGGHVKILDWEHDKKIYKAKVVYEDGERTAWFDGETGQQITASFKNIDITYKPGTDDRQPTNRFFIYDENNKIAIYDSDNNQILSEGFIRYKEIMHNGEENYSRCIMESGNSCYSLVSIDTGEVLYYKQDIVSEIQWDIIKNKGRVFLGGKKDEKIFSEIIDLQTGEILNSFEEFLPYQPSSRMRSLLMPKEGETKAVVGYIECESDYLKIIDWETGEILDKRKVEKPTQKFDKIVNTKNGKLYLKKFGGRKKYLES